MVAPKMSMLSRYLAWRATHPSSYRGNPVPTGRGQGRLRSKRTTPNWQSSRHFHHLGYSTQGHIGPERPTCHHPRARNISFQAPTMSPQAHTLVTPDPHTCHPERAELLSRALSLSSRAKPRDLKRSPPATVTFQDAPGALAIVVPDRSRGRRKKRWVMGVPGTTKTRVGRL